MKAEAGKRYALLQGGRVHWKFDAAELPEWHDGLDVIDVTDLVNEPDLGDVFDGTDFLKPVVPVLPAPAPRLGLDDLADLLVAKGIVTRGDVDGRKR